MIGKAAAGAALVLLVVAPPLLPSYFLEILITVLFLGYLGSSWNILGGYAGQFSFGHAAYFGLGAYTYAITAMNTGESTAAWILAILLPGILTAFLWWWFAIRPGRVMVALTQNLGDPVSILYAGTNVEHAKEIAEEVGA